MPLFGYREGSPQDVTAINRLGSTFSDALLGLQANRVSQQRWMAQQAMEQQRLQMEIARMREEAQTGRVEREKLKADTLRIGAETESKQASTKDVQQQTEAGKTLGFDLGQYSDLQKNAEMHPELIQAVISAIAKQQGIIASASPGTIGREVPRIMESAANPDVRRMIATDTPSMMSVPRGASVYDTMQRKPVFNNPYGSTRGPNDDLFQAARAMSSIGTAEARGSENPQLAAIAQRIMSLPGVGGGTNDQSQGTSPETSTIRVKSPDGRVGRIPSDQLQEALGQGYILAPAQ